MSIGSRYVVTVGLAVCALAAPGCKKKAGQAAAPAASPGQAVSPAAQAGAEAEAEAVEPVSGDDKEVEADAALGDKLHFYIGCVNRADSFVDGTYDHYTRWLTPKHKLDGKHDPIVRTNGSGADLTGCFKAIDEAAATEPKLPELEKVAFAYRDAHEKLEVLLVEADRYYSQGDFKDDKYAHGRELNDQIIAGFDAVFVARKGLRGAISQHNDELAARSLARLETREGKTVRYYTRRLLAEAQARLDLAFDPATDPAVLRDAIEVWKGLHAEFLDRHAKHPEEVARASNLAGFVLRSNNLLGAFKEVQRIAAAKAEHRKFEDEDVRKKDLLEDYNSLVDESNQLEWKAPE